MPEFDLVSIFAGVVAYGVAALGSVVLVFILFRWNTWITDRVEEVRLLEAGHRSTAIVLGATILSQAMLLRHAVFPIMTVVRDMFLREASWRVIAWVVAQTALFFVLVGALSVGSVLLAGRLFTRLTGDLDEAAHIQQDNLAVAIFYTFVLLAITLILNEGIEDFARSIIPYGRSGVIRLP